MRAAIAFTASTALALLSFCEVGLAFPVAWWLYLSVGLAFVLALIRPLPIRRQRGSLVAVAIITAVITALYLVNWTTRKPFLRELARVRVGMTEAEVRRIMGRYLENTGWPANPFDPSDNSAVTMVDTGSAARYFTAATISGELAIRNSLIFRHSTNAAFNSDWGIISLADGRVVKVEFSPD